MKDFNFEGLIPLLGGVYCVLLSQGILPRNPKAPEKWVAWREKNGRVLYLLGPALVVVGVLRVFRVL